MHKLLLQLSLAYLSSDNYEQSVTVTNNTLNNSCYSMLLGLKIMTTLLQAYKLVQLKKKTPNRW